MVAAGVYLVARMLPIFEAAPAVLHATLVIGAVTAILVTALGIGANTAVFSITDQVLLRPLPFPDSERLVRLWQHEPGYTRMELSPPNYLDWKRMSSSFEAMAAYYDFSMNLVGQGDPVSVETAVVQGDLFRILEAEPMMGRAIGAETSAAPHRSQLQPLAGASAEAGRSGSGTPRRSRVDRWGDAAGFHFPPRPGLDNQLTGRKPRGRGNTAQVLARPIRRFRRARARWSS
jgi:hypothetical protein